MKCYIKTLILSTIMLVIGNNSNYCHSIEIEEEININNNHNNNIINDINEQQIVNINQDNNEDYKHLFEVDYNKNHYDTICNACINNISKNAEKYTVFIKTVSELFDRIIHDLHYYNDSINFLKRQKVIAFDELKKFSKVFDSISLVNNTKEYKLLDNNNSLLLSQLKKYDKNTKKYITSNEQLTQREKYIRIDKLTSYGLLSPIDVIVYLQNSVRKLKAQVMKELEYSIINYKNVNANNEEIIKKAQQMLEEVHEIYYKRVSNNKFLYNIIKNAFTNFDKNIAQLDILHYNGSKLQTRFNNLHKKIMATLDKMINDINNNRLDNEVVYISNNIYKDYSKLITDEDSSYIKELFNEFNKNEPRTKWQLKEFLEKFKQKLEVVKKLTDRKINQQIETYHTLLDYQHEESICNYMLIQ